MICKNPIKTIPLAETISFLKKFLHIVANKSFFLNPRSMGRWKASLCYNVHRGVVKTLASVTNYIKWSYWSQLSPRSS